MFTRVPEIGAEQRFRHHKHHQYFGTWGALGTNTGKDKEDWDQESTLPARRQTLGRYLCEMCRHIDLTALFCQHRIPEKELPDPLTVDLYYFDLMLERRKCSSWRLIMRKKEVDEVIDVESEALLREVRFNINVLEGHPICALRLETRLSTDNPNRIPAQR